MIDVKDAEILDRAERQIRALLVEAASAGRYEAVSRLTSLARRLAEIRDDGVVHRPTAASSEIDTAPAEVRKEERQFRVGARKSSRKLGYPRFEKRRDILVKIGWSKKERREYVHKAPRTGVDAVVRRVEALGGGGKMFTTEELLPVKLGASGEELAGYQAYICLAWLVKVGVVQRHGREGYSLVGPGADERVTSAWEALPESGRRTGR